MSKKKIVVGVLALGLTGLVAINANAALPGIYTGGTLGFGDVHQGSFSNADINALTSSALGSNLYTTYSVSNSSSDTGLAGRLFAGYQIDDIWSVEMGWSKFSNAKANASQKVLAYYVVPANVSASGTIKTDAFDLVGKATLPLQDNFSVYGKAGAAYLVGRADVNGSFAVAGVPLATVSGSGTEHKVYPTFGVGVGYDITPNVVADISYNRIQKIGSSSDLASTDLVGAGLTYHFG